MTEQTTAEAKRLPEPFSTIWRWLHSLPIAIGVILVLAGLAALGTIIPQEHLAQPPLGMTLEQMYLERFGAAKYRLIQHLGLTRIYFTPYFFLLMLWLGVSSIICTLSRIRGTIGQYRAPRVQQQRDFFAGDQRAIVLEGVGGNALEAIEDDLRRRRFRTRRAERDGAQFLYADSGFVRQWALVAVHVSIIVLLLGGAYGKLYGTEGYIRMADGATEQLTLDFSKGKYSFVQPVVRNLPKQTYTLSQDHFRIDYDRKIQLPQMMAHMPSDLQEYYRYFVKDFVSQLSVERDGVMVSKEVKVNHPIRHGKLLLYQSGYQQRGYLVVEGEDGTEEYPVPSNIWFVLTSQGPASPEQAMALGELPDEAYLLDAVKAGDLYVGGVKSGYIGPLSILRVDTFSGGGHGGIRQLISPQLEYTTEWEGEPVRLRLSTRMDNFSDFSYKLDPGIPVLYFGWIVMIIGIVIAALVPLRRVWVRVDDGRAYLLVADRGGAAVARPYYVRWRELVTGAAE